MQKKIEIQASSLLEATQIAVAKLHVSEEKLFLNEIGENTYEALLDVNLALEGRKYLESILNAMSIEQFNIEVRTIGQESEIHYVIDSNENPLLIGTKGHTLEALQTLIKNLIGSYTKDYIVVTLDIGSYRANRIHQLEILATKTAKSVAKTKIAVKLDPMNSFERRVIHEKLADWRDVYTESEGEGEQRAIVIKPKN
ncbi:MAG: KH domain-containing protein [Acholeplasmatales bacterium]|nr:KH domain-containing protein [Acholeplasmatales bacterium]